MMEFELAAATPVTTIGISVWLAIRGTTLGFEVEVLLIRLFWFILELVPASTFVYTRAGW